MERSIEDDDDDDDGDDDNDNDYYGGVDDTVVTLTGNKSLSLQQPTILSANNKNTAPAAATGTSTQISPPIVPEAAHESLSYPQSPPPPPPPPQSKTVSTAPSSATTAHLTTTVASVFGPIQSAVVVLRNYGNYGIAERIVYHFNLLQQQQSSSSTLQRNSQNPHDMSVTSMTNHSTFLSTSSSTTILQPSLSSSLSSIPETTTATTTDRSSTDTTTTCVQHAVAATEEKQYGVIRLLECVPTRPWHKFTRRQRKDFKTAMRQFSADNNNETTENATDRSDLQNGTIDTIDPSSPPMPFILHSQTRLYMTYETTRIAYIIDASSTMTNSSTCCSTDYSRQQQQQQPQYQYPDVVCPIDRLVQMSRTFFTSLIDPIVTSSSHANYQPEFTITIIAVYPVARNHQSSSEHQSNNDDNHHGNYTSVLVRDYCVNDPMSADILCRNIEEFCYTEIETEIALRMSKHDASANTSSSSMPNMIDAGYVALSSLSNNGRPLIVIGTDCCCVHGCDNITMVGMESNSCLEPRNHPILDDVPIIVLDASSISPLLSQNMQYPNRSQQSSAIDDANVWDKLDENNKDMDSIAWMNDDPNDATVPLHVTNDHEMIYQLCQLTGGTFWNDELLLTGAMTRAGQVDSSSIFHQDYYFAFRKQTSYRKHSIQPNAIQWYILFQLSPLSPRTNDDWGKLPSPRYMSKLQHASNLDIPTIDIESPPPFSMDSTIRRRSMYLDTASLQQQRCTKQVCITFSNYIINPIPIHEVLLMRVKEGYRAKQYGQFNMSDGDRVSILFTLSLHMDITVRYELSFKANMSTLDDVAALSIGTAHIKIELEGDADLISIIKNQYLNNQSDAGRDHPQNESPSKSALHQTSTRICIYLRSIRKEDLLQSYLSPVKWTDQLSSVATPFIRRLGTLSSLQRRSHFCRNEFDCICVGHMPWDEDDFLSEFRDNDNGSQHLIDALKTWSTQTIVEDRIYAKQTHPDCGVAGYAIISIVQSSLAPRLYTITVETFSGMSAQRRQNLLKSIKDEVQSLRIVEVLPKQFCKSLVIPNLRRRCGPEEPFSQSVVESLQNCVSWDLVKDPELTSLLMKRRKEIGKFVLLDSCEKYGSFARIYYNEKLPDGKQDPGNLSLYHFTVLDDKVVVQLYMEYESETFFPFRRVRSHKRCPSTFHRLEASLKKRDQECGHALRCRTTLLQAFGVRLDRESDTDLYSASVQKLMGYSSKVAIPLRFFDSMIGDESNNILQNLTKESLLLQSFGPKVAELPMLHDIAITDTLYDGSWFIVEFDKYTCSIVHLSKRNEYVAQRENEFLTSGTFRELTFFTFGTTDLYNRRDDIDDDVMDDDHISEHLQVSEFCDSIQNVHARNYSYAAYLSLAMTKDYGLGVFSTNDVSEVMKMLDFVNVGKVTVNLANSFVHSHGGNGKFFEMFKSLISPFPNDSFTFYCNNLDLSHELNLVVEDNMNFDDEEDEHKSLVSQKSEEAKRLNFNELIGDDTLSELDECHEKFDVAAPRFVRFLVNDNPLSAANLDQIKNNSRLSVLISIFKEKSFDTQSSNKIDCARLPTSHVPLAAMLSFLLNAYVAELTLDQLLLRGSNLHDADVRQAKLCIRNASNVLICKVDLFFYSRNHDAIIKASEQHILGSEIDDAFDLLDTEMRQSKLFSIRSFDTIVGYLLECFDDVSNKPAHWCFVNMQRIEGLLNIEVYHLGGLGKAFDLMELVVDDIRICCHRVNQLILLQNLNDTRIASNLLIPSTNDSHRSAEDIHKEGIKVHFQNGHFECPVAYETSFELFHRLAANPMKVLRSLEAFVLQNFAVSNLPELFVYKDENGSIFYMKLKIQEPKTIVPNSTTQIFGEFGCIDLVVHGIGVPGSSITTQLRKLLHKHLLSIAVEMLSIVLTKNPRYHWRQLDIRFIKSFNEHANDQKENSPSFSHDCQTYAFPVSTFDPCMVALFFRQNLCGSTYFHPLLTSEWESSWSHDEIPTSSEDNMLLQPTDLVFFYNTSSSELDPSLQSESTLTSKGSRYSAQTGTGLAIIEVSLLNRNKHPLHKMKAAIPAPGENDIHQTSLESITLALANEFEPYDGEEPNDVPVFIQVKIADTALKTDILHDWISLSLNQALMAWNVERQLERIQNGLKSPFYLPVRHQNDWKNSTEKINSGLPILVEILEMAHELPHPTVLQVEYVGVVRSSIVATVSLDLLEKVVLDQIQTAVKSKLVPDNHYKLEIVRSSRSSPPQIVELKRDCSGGAVVHGASDQTRHRPSIIDSPIDCPEYTIFFYSPDYSIWNELGQNVEYPKLFREVAVGYEKSGEKGDFAKLLYDFKQQHISSFRRSIAFVLSVKRNRRRLLAYNWSSSLFKRTTKRLAEMEDMIQQSTGNSLQALHHRCLNILSPVSTVNGTTKFIPKHTAATTNVKVDVDVDRSFGIRQSTLPPTIRRPKLVGKSVEGSALQALAKSRARASATRFKGISQSNTPTAQRKHSSTTNAASSLSNTNATNASTSKQNGGDGGMENDNVLTIRKGYDIAVRSQFAKQSTIRSTVSQQVTKKYWPRKSLQTVSLSLVDFVFAMAPISWIDFSAMLPLPKFQAEEFLHSFGNAITTFYPELSAVHAPDKQGTFWLTGKLRNLKFCRGLIAIKIMLWSFPRNGRIDYMVSLEGRILTSPRQNKSCLFSNSTTENVSTGLDKLASNIRNCLGLQGQLFDHCAYTIERAIKSITNTQESDDIVSTLRLLIEMFPLRKVLKTVRSNYKCYKANIVLASYIDPIISCYNGIEIYNWLSSNVTSTNLISCGAGGLCFKKVVSVNGTQSICFLKFDDKQLGNMCLYILCRTQGKDLYEYMFREGSNFAVTIFSNIAIEAAGLAYVELRLAALNLRRDDLWKSFLTFQGECADSVHELQNVCNVIPLNSLFADNEQYNRLIRLCNDPALFDPNRFCDCLSNDPAFSETWQSKDSDSGSKRHLYYIPNDDVYLMVSLFCKGVQCHLELIVRQTSGGDINQPTVQVVQKIVNFLLYFLWDETGNR